MSNLNEIVARTLMVPEDRVTDELRYNSIPEWDSVAHMALVTELEDAFDVMLETDDIVAMSSVGAIRKILGKYGADA